MARGSASVNRVLDRLWIGSLRDVGPEVPLRALGFTAVLDLRDGFRSEAGVAGVEVHHLANRDGDPWTAEQVEGALAFVHDRIGGGGRVLVVCAAGMSRSASIAIGYLARCGWDAASAYARVREARGKIAPVGKMLESVMSVIRNSAGVDSIPCRVREELRGKEAVLVARPDNHGDGSRSSRGAG